VSDRVTQMLARLPEQFKGLPNIEALIRSFGEEFQEIEDALIQLRDERSIDTAVGVQLEDIGRRVGEPPSGLDTELYRRRIRARIATNRSKGRVEDLLRVARLILAETDGTVPSIVLERQQHAHMLVQVLGVPISTALADTLIAFLHAATKGAAGAGVRILLETSAYEIAERFSFENGAGLGYGNAARCELAPLTANVDTVVRSRQVGAARNNDTLTLEHDAGAPAGGTLVSVANALGGYDHTFTFLGGTTTVAQFEAAIDASELLHVYTVDGVGTMAAVSDEVAGAGLGQVNPGTDGGRYIGLRE
jgi:hypothetical protein